MQLSDYIEKIKSSPKFNNKNFRGDFPSPTMLKEKPHTHLKIIVEQAENLTKGKANLAEFLKFIGINPTENDIDWLIKTFIDDIRQFSTQHPDLQLLEKTSMWAQNRLPSYTLFTLSRARILPETYKNHIELHDQPRSFDLFSVPFIIRLSIEQKLKAIIGFESSELKLSNGRVKSSDQFPALKVINFLTSSDLVDSPLPFSEIKKIYNWSCGFVHTGKKEYIWLSLKAVSLLNKLFSRDCSCRYGVAINYLKDGVSIQDLQAAINASPGFIKSNEIKISEESISLSLSADEFDETAGFWDKRQNH